MNNQAAQTRANVLSETELRQFHRDGFLVARGLADAATCRQMTGVIHASLAPPLAPLEFEADVKYPGAPADRQAPGGDTPRRLLYAYTRHESFRAWAKSPAIVGRVRQLLGAERLLVSQNHHNCIMTKYPGFSSETHWHKDIRYWRFDRPELISVWLALGDEYPDNGGLQLLPATHQLDLDRGRYDAANFLRADLPDNRRLIDTTVNAELTAGDVLLFHCRTLHAAGRNRANAVKLSLVFTYRADDNQSIVGTRSARFADIVVS